MTRSIALVYGHYNNAADTVGFTARADGFSVGFTVREWPEGVTGGRGELVTETIAARLDGTSHDDLATRLQSLDDMVNRVQQYRDDPSQSTFVYLRRKMDDETSTRVCKVHDLSWRYSDSLGHPPTTPGNIINNITLVVQRAPYWEYYSTGTWYKNIFNTSILTHPTGTYFGKWDYSTSGLITGTAQARLASTIILDSSGTIAEAWFGSTLLEDFNPVWQLEDYVSKAADTTLVSSSGDSGQTMRWTPAADLSLSEKLIIRVADTTSSIGAQRGMYTVLLRAKATGTRTYQARLSEGWYGGNSYRPHLRQKIGDGSNNNWMLYPLGVVQLPPERFHYSSAVSSGFFSNYALRLEVGELGTGTGNLDMDLLYLIPRQNGGAYVKLTPIGGTTYIYINQDPDDRIYGYANSSGAGKSDAVLVDPARPYGLPPGGGYLVFVGQRTSQHTLTDSVQINFHHLPRWHSLRGGES